MPLRQPSVTVSIQSVRGGEGVLDDPAVCALDVSNGCEPAKEAANAIRHALNEGMLVSFQFTVSGQVDHSFTMSQQINDSMGGSGNREERYLFSITDPNALHHAFEVQTMNTEKGKKRFSMMPTAGGVAGVGGGGGHKNKNIKTLEGMEKEYDDVSTVALA